MELFRTVVHVPPSKKQITHHSLLLLMGSCFSEYIAAKFTDAKFNVDNNPFGIAYNPLSIKKGLLRLMDNKPYVPSDLFQQDGLWFSFDHHSRFAGTDVNLVLHNINKRISYSASSLKKADILFLTFGTSLVYLLAQNGEVVTNCHKIPSSEFMLRNLTAEDIIHEYNSLFKDLYQYNPEIHIVFTVSPVRYWKDGAHENQLSKASLLLAIDQLCHSWPCTHYFPSYELMMDDLRDYRFYAEDMLHPNGIAVDYIWQRIRESFMDAGTIAILEEIEKVKQAFHHKPFNPTSLTFRSFALKCLDQINSLSSTYNINFTEEEQYFRSFL